MDYIISHITKTFKFGSDIAFALKKEKLYDMDQKKPKLKASTAKNDKKQSGNQQFNYRRYARKDRSYLNWKLRKFN
jgi:hypothetical protein